jgi:Domain of unknown function (DUF4328)
MTPDSEFIDPNDGFPPLQPPRRPQVRVRGSVDFTAPLTSLAIAVRIDGVARRDVSFLLTAVVYLVWFYRARTNVEHYEPQFQRRSVGWALGGWLPIVSFWVPYQVTTDILLDSRQSLRAPADVWRRSFGVLQAWWAAWLARYVFFLAERSAPSHTPHQFENLKLIEMGGALAQIVAGVLAILVVGAITNTQRERRAEWDAA